MVFSSAISLFFFVPIVFLLDRRLSDVDAKNTWLLLASLVFYSFGQVYYLPLLLLSVALNYVCGRLAAGKYAKLGVTLAVIGGIGLLAVFKYADFAIRTVNALCGLHLPLTGIALPIGISFFTFQGLSYVIDVYREPKMVSHSFKKVLLYIAFFPQLIAGPIVKYHDIEQEIDSRRTTPQETALGIRRFICGLSKKLLLSNALGQMADTVFALPAGEIGMLAGWTGAICYTLQIYFDFSGYSDMAIGLGKLFGFDFLENFNYPFISKSITEFWRRWHMSLGTWFRDYVYIPLGGSRVSLPRHLFNIFLVWMLTGFWHGAAWNFVIWGLYFALLLILEKIWLLEILKKSHVLNRIYVLTAAVISFVIFDATDMSQAFSYLKAMFGTGGYPLTSAASSYYFRSYFVVLMIALLGATPIPKSFCRRIQQWKTGTAVMLFAEPLALSALLLICTAFLVDGSFNPFLYFRF